MLAAGMLDWTFISYVLCTLNPRSFSPTLCMLVLAGVLLALKVFLLRGSGCIALAKISWQIELTCTGTS